MGIIFLRSSEVNFGVRCYGGNHAAATGYFYDIKLSWQMTWIVAYFGRFFFSSVCLPLFGSCQANEMIEVFL